ncbi:MAG: DUF3108 domain-containing protein [Bacteroidales bacterium]|jgi:hypothetical protein|nr:DUF3108 domain-containing protein [Bacteroidales bacterium]
MKKITGIALFILMFVVGVSAKKEEIKYDLKFGIIKGGEASLIISDTKFNDKNAVHYYLIGQTTGVTNVLFNVYDIYETTVDAETMLPLKAIRNIKEKKYRWYNETLFYHDVDSIDSQRTGWQAVPKNLVDIVSVFFYFVNKHMFDDIEKGYTVSLPTYHADKISDITVKYSGEEKIDTDLGKIDCYILSPIVDKGKLLNRSDGLKLYISKENKIPVLLEFDMKAGTLRAVLKSYNIDGVKQTAI